MNYMKGLVKLDNLCGVCTGAHIANILLLRFWNVSVTWVKGADPTHEGSECAGDSTQLPSKNFRSGNRPAGRGQKWAAFLPLICCFWRFNLQLRVNFSPTLLKSSLAVLLSLQQFVTLSDLCWGLLKIWKCLLFFIFFLARLTKHANTSVLKMEDY